MAIYNPITDEEIDAGRPVFGPVGFAKKVQQNFEFLLASVGTIDLHDVQNGSFELEDDENPGSPLAWDISLYPGGANSLNDVTPAHGALSLCFTHPGGASNGGGYADSNFVPIQAVDELWLHWLHWVTAAGMRVMTDIRYFDKDLVFISSENVYDSVSNPTSPFHASIQATTVPATARFIRARLVGGEPTVDVAGNAYFDDMKVDFRQADATVYNETLRAAAVSQAKLKTSQSTAQFSTGLAGDQSANRILPGGEYGFAHQLQVAFTAGAVLPTGGWEFPDKQIPPYGPTQLIKLVTYKATGAGTVTVDEWVRYVTSSGEIYWMFFLRLKDTGYLTGGWECPDHVCFGNGGDPEKLQHPFPDFDPEKHDIIVIQGPQDATGKYPKWVRDIKAEHKASGRSILTIAREDYDIVTDTPPAWDERPVTVGLDDDDVYPGKEGVRIIKKSVTKPDWMLHGKLVKKT